MKFFVIFMCSIVLATLCIVFFQNAISHVYGNIAELEEKYSFLYFVIFLTFTSFFFFLLSKNMITRLEEINQNVKKISKGNLDVQIQTMKNDEIGQLATNINKMTNSLKKSIEKEKLAQKMKNEMISNISHDLRTPVTSLIGYVDLIEHNFDVNKENCQQYVRVVKRKSRELKNQVDDLLEYCHINYREIQLHKEIVGVKQLVEQVMIDFIPQLEAVQMKFHIECNQDLQIEADISLLVRLMQNVISNSISYGKSGKIIDIQIFQENRNVKINIKNYGKKILQEDIPYIFEKFYRGEKSRSAHTGGKGMGLAIAKSIANIHKGDITVYSDDKETVFTLIFPQYSMKP
ncbi:MULTISPECIES: cell wall metabolism sensor histidine kinase WalK [unclassified Bacillus (in: firmicutes)]|uniref:sensor histidine kinase n=1 Tax=unclassified Bacillus (in: firmicutes) TaxID=185979 RepID=UPI0011135B3F|nr:MULTISPECIES: HAMP domain-containing sensor histidine kinase [unclassified Bacillus (in: firmicutes)]